MWPREDISQDGGKTMKQFTASDAQRLAKDYANIGGDLYNKVTAKILAEIKDAASRGGYALYVTKHFNNLDYVDRAAVQKHLELVGFKVESVYDQRDGDYHKVTW